MSELLRVEVLKKYFPIHGGVFQRQVGQVHAVDSVSFGIKAGDTLGLVGESGCGKSTVGRAILRLHEPTAGRILFNGVDLTSLGRRQLRLQRRELQIIFQDPFESLNPRHTVGHIVEEPLIVHGVGGPRERREAVRALLERVGLQASAAGKFPHEFSGGQRQRIGIARAIALKPKLVVCDEPVSALDVSIQSQILNLLLELQEEMGLAYLFIAHDLAVVKHISDRIAVMYLGRIVELAEAEQLYRRPAHPYTQALISSIPVPDPKRKSRSTAIRGEVPSPINPPSGCHFHTRCPRAAAICRERAPELAAVSAESGAAHIVACHFPG